MAAKTIAGFRSETIEAKGSVWDIAIDGVLASSNPWLHHSKYKVHKSGSYPASSCFHSPSSPVYPAQSTAPSPLPLQSQSPLLPSHSLFNQQPTINNFSLALVLGSILHDTYNGRQTYLIRSDIMEDSYSIQISGKLVQQLASEDEKFKKKTRKPRAKAPQSPRQSETKSTQEEIPDDSQTHKTGPLATGWPLQPPLFYPAPHPPVSANAELEAIRSTLHESERVVERLQKLEEEMAIEVTQRAKELHDKEFKLPYQKPMPCSADYSSCLDCYKEHAKDPLKCATLVEKFADCARSARQQVNSADT